MKFQPDRLKEKWDGPPPSAFTITEAVVCIEKLHVFLHPELPSAEGLISAIIFSNGVESPMPRGIDFFAWWLL